MHTFSRRRWSRSRSRSRFLRTTLLAVITLFIVDFLRLSWPVSAPGSHAVSKGPIKTTEKIFVASTHWNNEAILRSHWNAGVVNLAKHVGPNNIYVSVYESGSWDDSKGALRLLDRELEELGVQRTIVLDETTHADELAKPAAATGWIETARGSKELRRIPYLSALRNRSLKPLAEMALNGVTFDKVLFLNDVVFTTEDVMTLLRTRNGDYAAACSLDFSKPPQYYDTFALRDSEGHEPVTVTYPYFRSGASRKAIMAHEAVPVQSCWNGMAVFNAAPFYGTSDNAALRFRGIADSLAAHHLEASECCLIHADNPLTPSRGVWLNPNVRVGYNLAAYEAVHPAHPSSSSLSAWPPLSERIRGVWTNRFWRWVTWTWPQAWRIARRVRRWEEDNPGEFEPGVACLINEMQVLVENGWAHV